ncbi:hypothetical protein V2J09_017818 [Rumex salicifolius]
MKIYIKSNDVDLWDITIDGPYVPMKKNENGEVVPKLKSEWNAEDKKAISMNNKAMKLLIHALSDNEYSRVSACTSVKEIWELLCATHEGKVYTTEDQVRKVMQKLPKKWVPKVTIIKEAKDLSSLPLEHLIGSLTTHKDKLKSYEEEITRSGTLALKVSKAMKQVKQGSVDKEDKDPNVAFITNAIRKLGYKEQHGSFKKNPNIGHISRNCPQKKEEGEEDDSPKKGIENGKQKAFVAACGNEDFTYDNEPESWVSQMNDDVHQISRVEVEQESY